MRKPCLVLPRLTENYIETPIICSICISIEGMQGQVWGGQYHQLGISNAYR